MSKTSLLLFWIFWLLDVLIALFGHREFIMGVFGHYASPTRSYILLWTALLSAGLLIIGGSLYLKNHGYPVAALGVAAVPLVLALPYVLWLLVVIFTSSSGSWR